MRFAVYDFRLSKALHDRSSSNARIILTIHYNVDCVLQSYHDGSGDLTGTCMEDMEELAVLSGNTQISNRL